MEELYIINADKRGRLSTRTKTIPTRNNDDDGDDNRSTRSAKSSSGKRAVDTKNKEQKDFFSDDKSVFSRLSIKSSTSKGIVGSGRKQQQQQQYNEVSDDRSVFSRLSSVASVSRSVANKHNDGTSSVFSRRNSNSPGRGGSDRKKYYDNSDDRSVSSRNSRKSSGGGGGGGNGGTKKTTMHSTKRYEYPFDAQGYCHMHPHIKLATKKLTGGWKINCDFCPECGDEDDDNRSMGSRNSRKSTSSRRSTKSSSSKKGLSRSKSSSAGGGKKSRPKNNNNDDSDTMSELSSIQFKRNSPNSKNDQSTKNSKIEKDKEVSPKFTTSLKKGTSHGSSSSKVEWDKELPKINSSLKKGSSSIGSSIDKKQSTTPSLPSDSQRQNALLAYKQLYNSTARVVKNMIFEDIHGKLGRYTGEVNELKLPHGMGDIVYDSGFTQGGNWVSLLLLSFVVLCDGPIIPTLNCLLDIMSH
jgi:hypothetical protein